MIWISIFLALLSQNPPETLEFNIVVRDDPVGELLVDRRIRDHETVFTSRSTTKARIMFGVTVEVRQEVRFENGIMTYAHSVTRVNGDEHKKTEIKKNGSGYIAIINGDRKKIDNPVKYSVIQMYFEAPGQRTQVFSEHEGGFHRVERERPGKYIKIDNKGDKNYYTYGKQYLDFADVDAGWYRFEVKAKGSG